MNSPDSVKATIEQLSSLQSEMPEDGSLQPEIRNKMQRLAKELGWTLETPFDTLTRLVFLVCIQCVPAGCIETEDTDLGLLQAFPTCCGSRRDQSGNV